MPTPSRHHRDAPAPAEGLLAALSGGLLVMALLLGGATREGELWNAGIRLASLPVLLLAIYRLMLTPLERPTLRPLAIVAGLLCLPLVQLIPLPPLIWEHLPGRADFGEAYRAARMAPPWLPLSLNPEGALNGFLALLPAVAVFLATLTLSDQNRRRLLFAVMVVGVAALGLGAAQLLKDDYRLYDLTNPQSAVGFFSNRNHQAGFLLTILPVATAWAAISWRRWGPDRSMAIVFGAALVVALVAGAVMSKSRAGLLLAPPAFAACLLLLLRDSLFRTVRKRFLLIAAATLAVTAGAGLLLILLSPTDGVSEALSGDVRARSLPAIVTASFQYFPFGSGLGSFEAVYKTQERPETMINAFLNHAHNDYIEIFLETGLFGLALVAVFMAWFGSRTISVWRDDQGAVADTARVGTIVVGLLLTHSLVDYPLRTAAVSTLFALACGLLLPTVGAPAPVVKEAPPERLPPPRRVKLHGRR